MNEHPDTNLNELATFRLPSKGKLVAILLVLAAVGATAATSATRPDVNRRLQRRHAGLSTSAGRVARDAKILDWRPLPACRGDAHYALYAR